MASLDTDGFAIVEGVLANNTVVALRAECDRVMQAAPAGSRRRAGMRGIVSLSESIAAAASSAAVVGLASAALGGESLLVRSILFDKSAEANWDVPWHRDTTVAVRERRDTPGYGPWSIKEGVPHVQPPVSVLSRMITLRIHVDPCPATNGALLVVPGSHDGVDLASDAFDPRECDRRAVACEAGAGDVVMMRPLLLHASRKSTEVSRRRVLHLEFASGSLLHGLEWACS